MLDVREIARGIYRVALGEEQDLIQGGLLWPGVTLNLFVIQAEKPCIIQTGLRLHSHDCAIASGRSWSR
jgi:hypothetical protein